MQPHELSELLTGIIHTETAKRTNHHALPGAACQMGSCTQSRLTSLILDAALPEREVTHIERCLHFSNGSCNACVQRCPVGALHEDG